MQDILGRMIGLFGRVGVQTNGNKTKAMICTLVLMWGGGGVEGLAYKRRVTR